MHYIASIICTPTENFTIHPRWAGNKRHSHENHKLSLCQTPSTTLGRENCLTRSSLISEMNFLQFANRDLTTASFTKCPKLVLLLLLMMLRESLSSGALCAVRFSFTPHRTVLCACVSSSTTNIKSTTSHNYMGRSWKHQEHSRLVVFVSCARPYYDYEYFCSCCSPLFLCSPTRSPTVAITKYT